MRLQIDARLDYRLHAPADLLLAVEVAQADDQRLLDDRLTTTGTSALVPVVGEDGVGQRTWTRGAGHVAIRYSAMVEVARVAPDLAELGCSALPGLPAEVAHYLWPSRYCESDRFESFVRRQFGTLVGGAKVAAMARWVQAELSYVSGASDGTTTAAATFVRREGVCRDYAHLLIALVRAADIPARMVGAYGLGVHPPDFHAVVEVWLDDAWHLLDPTGLAKPEGIVRIAVGRDATDVGFLTIFGTADLVAQSVIVARLD